MQARMTDSHQPPNGAGSGKTAQGYIAGIGASGALLAGAVVTFVFLVGTVSFDVGADADSEGGTRSLGVAELSGGGDGSASASLGTTVALLVDSVPTPDVPPAAAAPDAAPRAKAKVEGELTSSGGSDQGSGGTGGGVGGTGDGSGGSGTAGGDPGGGGGGGTGDNPPSDRPSHSNPRPGGGSGSTGTGTATTPPAGSTGGSDRPTAGDRGRG